MIAGGKYGMKEEENQYTWNLYDFINQCHPNKFNKNINKLKKENQYSEVLQGFCTVRLITFKQGGKSSIPVSYTHLRAHETS